MTTTRRVALKVGKHVFDHWTEVEVVRDLSEISGSFRLTFLDQVRAARALGRPIPDFPAIACGQSARIEIDGELVLDGWIDDVALEWSADNISASITGRDRTGDLVDCAAAPEGPAEFVGVTLLEIAQRLCTPFGLKVRAEVDVSRRFDRFSIDVAETAMSALDKATRQSAVLLVSDGVGGLVLTRSGINRAPAPLRMGETVAMQARTAFSWRQRFSDYWYKAQQEKNGHTRSGGPALDHTAAPLAPGPLAPPRQPQGEVVGVLRTGHARDSEVTRYRPKVRLVRTESAGASAQEQADWMMRTSRGASESITYSVHDWRAGPQDKNGRMRLWRPNELVQVLDRYAGIDRDMLIAGVSYSYSEQGSVSELRVVGPEAFDRIREDARRRRRHHGDKPAGPLDSSARGLG